MKLNICILSPVLFFCSFLKAQQFKLTQYPDVIGIHESGFTINWQSEKPVDWLEWKEDKSEFIHQLSFQDKSTGTWEFKEGSPSKIYEVVFGQLSGNDSLKSKPYYFATKSLSSGKIRIFFNHPTTTQAATFAPAPYLNEAIDDTLIAYFNRAESTIDIAIYNSTTSSSVSSFSNALNAAHDRGVRVRVVYDASTSNLMLDNLNPAIGKIESKIGFNYGIMHNKFVVFDVESADPMKQWVWTGSTNWTVNQLNGPDENNVIAIQDKTLAQAYLVEFEEMYGGSDAQPNVANARFGPDKFDNTPHVFIIGGKIVQSYFSPSDGVNQQIINTINSANNDLYFASMIITRNDIGSAIVNKVNQGLTKTYGITNDSLASPPAPEVWQTMRTGIPSGQMISKNGFSGTMHHKFLFVDHSDPSSDPRVLTGSHNWSTGAENRNDENTLIVYDHDVVNQYYQAFLWMFNNITGGTLNVEDQIINHRNLIVYPNPASNQIRFEIDNDSEEILKSEIIDLSGRTISTNLPDYNGNKGLYDINQLSPGIYLMKITTKNFIYTNRFIKN